MMKELTSRSNGVKDYLKDTLSRHYDVVYTPEEAKDTSNSEEKAYTVPVTEFTLDYTDNSGKRHVAATIAVFSYGDLMAELLYSAWLGWREERKEHVTITLDMDEVYDMILRRYGSYIEIPVESDPLIRAHNYSFSILDSTQSIVEDDKISIFGDIKYLIDKVDLFKDEVYEDMNNVPVQSEETVEISEEDWWKYHLGLKSIEEDWNSLRETHGITAEQKDKLYQDWAHAMGYETEL